MKMHVCFSVILMFLSIFFINGALSKLERLKHPVKKKSDGSLSFLVIGDWGRKGGFNQSLVAHQVSNINHFFNIYNVLERFNKYM